MSKISNLTVKASFKWVEFEPLKLNQIAIQQMCILQNIENRKLLK
jgi:hypothetical protein